MTWNINICQKIGLVHIAGVTFEHLPESGKSAKILFSDNNSIFFNTVIHVTIEIWWDMAFQKVVSYALCFVCWEYMCLVVKCEQKEVLFYAGTRSHATPFTYNSVFIPLHSSHSACTVAHDYLCIRYNEDTRLYFCLLCCVKAAIHIAIWSHNYDLVFLLSAKWNLPYASALTWIRCICFHSLCSDPRYIASELPDGHLLL